MLSPITSMLLVIILFVSSPITAFAVDNNDVYALSYHVGSYDMFPEGDGSISVTIDGTKYFYSDDYDNYDDISNNFNSMENQNVLYELHENKIVRVYSLDNVLTPKVTVEPSIKEGLIYRNGKFSQNSFDVVINVSNRLTSTFQKNDLLWFLNDNEKERLYTTLKKLEIEPSNGVDFGSSGWWLWKEYQTNISENFNDNIKVNETKEYHYTVNLQNDKVLNQKEYDIELYTTPTFDFGTGERTTSKIKVGNLDYQEEKTEEKKANSTSGKSVTQASTKLAGVKNALQFSKNLLNSDQTEQVNEFVNLWISELILARCVDKSDIKQNVSEQIANQWLSKLGLDTSVLLIPGTIQATTYLKTQTKDGTQVFIELYINLTSFDFGNSGMPTMATGSGSATIYNMNGEQLDSSVILPAYADVCAFCEQLQKIAKDTIFNGAKQYRTIFGIDTDATAEALSSQIMVKLLNNNYTKDVFKRVDAKGVKTALKKLISEGDKKCGNKIFELVTTPSQNSTLISVKCPVDVTVYDNDGNICGMVRNNVVDTSYGDVFISVVGDQKNIYLIGDDYTFTLSGTDSGKMDYVVTEFDESGTKSREITYSNIELSDGCNYYSYVPEAENHNSSLFDLTDSDGNVISATTGMDIDIDIDNQESSDVAINVGDTFKINDITYKVTSADAVEVYRGKNGIVKIPSMVCYQNKLFRVTKIGYSAFKYSSVTKITIPDSVISIGNYAFYDTNITSIYIPNSVTGIGDYAFYDSDLKNITVSSSVVSVGGSAFGCTAWYNNQLDGVVYAGKVAYDYKGKMPENTSLSLKDDTTGIADYAFYHCENLTNIFIPNSVKNIGKNAFYECSNLSNVNIPNGVMNIGYDAFYKCTNITSITVSDSLVNVDSDAFYGCNIKEIIISDGSKEVTSQMIVSNKIEKVVMPDSLISIGNEAFYKCSNLKSVDIPDHVTSIGRKAFESCTELTSVIIPNEVTNIDYCAFYNCTNLITITISDSIMNIGSLAFNKCDNIYEIVIAEGSKDVTSKMIVSKKIEKVVIPNSVLSVGDEAFYGCTKIKKIKIGNCVDSVGDYAFYGCTGLEDVAISNSTTNIGYEAFGNCSSLININIPSGLTNIDERAFYNCTSLTNITIPDSVTSIKYGVFSGCESIKSIVLGNGITSIGKSAFSACSSLENLIIPDSVSKIDEYAFSGCTNLTTLKISDSITSVSGDAFYHCNIKELIITDGSKTINSAMIVCENTLEIVRIPDSVTEIGNDAFYLCNSLTSIKIPDSVTSIGEYAFFNCKNLIGLTIPDSVISIGKKAFSGCTSLKSVKLGNGLTNIEKNAFDSCTNLENIVIGKNVTSIGQHAFEKCISLTSITLPDSVKSIGSCSFSGCTSLESIKFSNNLSVISTYAFEECTALKEITIPEKLIALEGGVFNNCTSLETVYFNAINCSEVGQYGYNDYANPNFSGCTALKNVIFSEKLKTIPPYIFQFCRNLEKVVFPNDITEIGKRAFSNCTSLKEITIPDKVEIIREYAFNNCSSLNEVKIPSSVTNIYWEAFYGCTSMMKISIPSSVSYIGFQAFGYYYDAENNNINKKIDGFTIYGYSGTEAEVYASANENSFKFVSIGSVLHDNKTNISVTIANDAELSVKKLTDRENVTDVISVLDKNEMLVDLYDISLTKDGVAIQPDEPATVKIPTINENAKVYRIEDNGTATDMNAVYDNGYMVFTTDHFSIYALVIPNDNVTGDVNGDGVISVADAVALQKYIIKSESLSDEQLAVADTDGNGDVNIKDVTQIQKYLAKFVTVLG